MWSVETVGCLLFLTVCTGIDIRYRIIPTVMIVIAAAGSAAGLLLIRGDWVLAAGGALIGGFCLAVSKLTRQRINKPYDTGAKSGGMAYFQGIRGIHKPI